MAILEINLLGAPRILQDGSPVEFDTRKATALLAYLAVTEQPHTRDTLATLLWPDYDQIRARAALRRTLSTVNRALEGQHLEIRRDTIEIKLDPGVWVDTKHFQELSSVAEEHNHLPGSICQECIERLEGAVALYHGDFLAGFSLRDSVNFDDWQFFQSDSLRRQLGDTLEKLVEYLCARGSFLEAIPHAGRWLSLDLLREDAHRWLMKCYEWSGRHNAALRQYRECVRVLDKELGVSPLEETEELYTTILKRQLPVPTPETIDALEQRPPLQPVIDISPTALHFPLVGRSEQLGDLIQVFNTHAADGYFTLVYGEAGIGKTRLAEEFIAYASNRGANVLTMRCYEGEKDLAFSPFIGGMRAALSQKEHLDRLNSLDPAWLVEAARLLPELRSAIPDLPQASELTGPGAQTHFYESLRQLLLALLGGSSPGVLFLDDLHWADVASLDLLTYITHRLRDCRIFVLAACRDEAQETVDRVHQIRTAASRTSGSKTLTLARLSESELNNLTQSAEIELADLPPDFSKRLYTETEGLPFFAIEYLNALTRHVRSHSLKDKTGVDWSLPESVRDLLNSRLNAASQAGAQLTSTAAVIGRAFDFHTLHLSSGRSQEETLAGLEELIDLGLVKERTNGDPGTQVDYDFSHNKLRALAYEQTSIARRRLLHRRVAEALVEKQRERGEPGTDSSLIAHHYLKAGDDVLAAKYFYGAGERAFALYAHKDALFHYQAALSSGFHQPSLIHEAVGDIRTLLGEYQEAIQSYERSAALANPDHIAAIEVKLGDIYHRLGDYELAICYFQSALDAIQSGESGAIQNSAFHARLLADWSRSAHHLGDSAQALALAEEALSLAQSAQDAEALAQVHNMLGILARKRQDLSAASQHLEKSLQFSESIDLPEGKIAALNNLGLVYSEIGELNIAIEKTTLALEICEKIGDRHRSAALNNHLADLYHLSGQPECAMAYLKTAVTIFGEIDHTSSAPKPQIWMLIEW